jgi:acetolactate synthase-1/2/3 large subunit
MPQRFRGADLVVRTLEQYGASKLFGFTGNHVMPIFDAVQDTNLEIIHVRHEAAAVHMAEAWSRVTGKVGFALATGGQGHTNGAAALFNLRSSDSAVVYLSGHAALHELGRGAFQEMDQAEMVKPVTKASWTAQSASTLGSEVASAIRTAASGRPGPVHLSLPLDLLEQEIGVESPLPEPAEAQPVPIPLADAAADLVLAKLAAARRPLILCGPALCTPAGRAQMRQLEAALQIPVIGMESPRGINDPSLGAFPEIIAQADLILLLSKALDFSLRFGAAPFIAETCRFIAVHPEAEGVARVAQAKRDLLVFFAIADHASTIKTLLAHAEGHQRSGWCEEVNSAIGYRPKQWQQLQSKRGGVLHPTEACREIDAFLKQHPNHTVACDGGEFSQWAQSLLTIHKRIINGLSGSIGVAMPYALAAKAASPDEVVMAIMGDGTFGFHMAEFDTALRYNLPVIVIVGNDACWNAEYQIQLRSYGPERAKGCELLPAHYEKAVEALGGHGEYVTSAGQIAPALTRALASGRPACVNIRIESVAAPIVSRARECHEK